MIFLRSRDGHFSDHCLKGTPRGPCARTECTQPFQNVQPEYCLRVKLAPLTSSIGDYSDYIL